jgi:hypothetical protein
MGTSRKSNVLIATLQVLAVVLLGTCASALRIESRNLNSTLTVFVPPGCCSSCVPTTDTACSGEQCGYVAVGVGEGVALDSHVGPYPLPYLKIQIQDKVYCVPEEDLRGLDLSLIAATSTLYVIESAGERGKCGPDNSGVVGTVIDNTLGVLSSICLDLCAAWI